MAELSAGNLAMALLNISPIIRSRAEFLLAAMRGETGRSVGALVKGTLIGHAITAAAMPILTRIYTPADFSIAQLFASLVAIFVAVACLRFDMAIPLPADRREGFGLLFLSLVMILCVSTAIAAFLFLAPPHWLDLLNNPGLLPYLDLVPVAVAFGGGYQAMQMWFVREKRFQNIASSRIQQSSAMAVGQIGLGAVGVIPFGLIAGQLLNHGVGFAGLFIRTSRGFLDRGLRPTLGEVRALAASYSRFPRYSVWEALANAASLNLPLLIIGAFASGPEVGYLMLAWFLLQVPMALVGNAVGQVYLSAAPEADRRGELGEYTRLMIRGLARAAIIPIIGTALVSPLLFSYVFGPGWERAGWLVTWMAPWCFFQLLASPVSGALHVRQRQRLAMWLQLAGLTLRVGAVTASGLLAVGWISEIYALSGALFYGWYLRVILRVIR